MSRRLFIGIAGPMGSGKTTVAGIIESLFTCGSLVHLPFALLLKEMARDKFGWDGKKDERGRRLLQDLGMAGREYDNGFWVKKWEAKVGEFPNVDLVIVDDVRFGDEEQAVITHGGFMIYLHRPGCNVGTHPSEHGLLPDPAKGETIENDGTTDDLVWKVRDVVRRAGLFSEFPRRTFTLYSSHPQPEDETESFCTPAKRGRCQDKGLLCPACYPINFLMPTQEDPEHGG